MCDYSLMHVKSRAARQSDRLVSSAFPETASKGFASVDDTHTAVCVLPGTELVFDAPVRVGLWDSMAGRVIDCPTARFRQIDLDNKHTHHDALEFADGEIVLLNLLRPGQHCTVLQLPAAPKNEGEAQAQKRLEVVA